MIKKYHYIFCLDGGASKSISTVFDTNGNKLEKNVGGLCNIENNFNLCMMLLRTILEAYDLQLRTHIRSILKEYVKSTS